MNMQYNTGATISGQVSSVIISGVRYQAISIA